MRFTCDWRDIVGGIICLAVAFGYPTFNPVTANAATGPAGIQSFQSGVECTASELPVSLELAGRSERRQPMMLTMYPEPGKPWVRQGAYQVFVNGVLQLASGTTPDGWEWTIPAWDGVDGHQPQVTALVLGPDRSQGIYFSVRDSNSTSQYQPIAVGSVADGGCTITSNPIPQRP